uniref:Chromodomain-helicase-DNA-binding protein 1-like n=1 Tax=Cyprinus carpio TaxID=7962 RepID=A0A8C2Q0F1_CYPCA
MSQFLRAVKNNIPEKEKSELTESDLKKWGLEAIHLRFYQVDGVRWLSQCMKNQQGCILGDEMGLGKTCQTISLLAYARGCLKMNGPFLVLCPLSVLENWRQELERFCPSLSVICYTGDKERRAELQKELRNDQHFHVLLTTYEMCLKDARYLKSWKWKILVVDEAHRLKNQESLLHQTLKEFTVGFRVLLTGTPIQNNLQEVYSLLTFIQPSLFLPEAVEDFVSAYADVQTEPALADELHRVLQPFLLRRVKAEVAAELPKKTDLVVFHGLSALQKRYYKAILMRDLDAFRTDQNTKTRLLNILMQLRKCVDHPYLFDGVEPEPFEMGEHLVKASGKLSLLDTMLAYLQEGGHRVLLFSQMTRMLDILQDYLEYRGYSYERLDGSVRGEERNLAIKNFSSKDVFIFLLSTKAGGVGMNLTAADTVIFVDSDFNPQNDLQAAARAHRIGQTRPVKVIRLLGRDTVEEIIYSRAVSKLRLTDTVIEEGRFSLLDQAQSAASGLQLSEILKFGVDKLLSSEESSIQDVDLRLILGQSRDGRWLTDEEHVKLNESDEEEDEDMEGQNHMYYFEGKDYSKDPSAEDEKTFELLLEKQLADLEDAGKEGRALRNKAGVSLSGPLIDPGRKKRPLTESELEQRRQKRQEAAAKRAKLQEDRKKQQEELNYKKKMAWWESCGYKSLCLPQVDSEGEDIEPDEDDDVVSWSSTDSDHTAIHYVLGDVTHPQADRENAIIVHCVDDSGHWGRGGLFTALELRSDEPKKQYQLAGDMEDLELGNVLLFPIDDKQSRLSGRDYLALIVAQQRDKANNLSGIRLTALDEGLKKIYRDAKQKNASVHLPRIGHSTKGFNWYGTERLIRKHLATKGISTFIYYYKRATSRSFTVSSTTCTSTPSTSHSASDPAASSPSRSPHSSSALDNSEDLSKSPKPSTISHEGQGAPGLADFMRGVHVYFYNMAATEKKKLARYLITYPFTFHLYPHDLMSSNVTHIVAEVESPIHAQELRDLLHQYPQTLLVKKNWLESCFANQRKVSVSKYVIRLT